MDDGFIQFYNPTGQTRTLLYSDCPEILNGDPKKTHIVSDSDASKALSDNGITTVTYTLKPNEIVDIYSYINNNNNNIAGSNAGSDVSMGVIAFPYSGSGEIILNRFATGINSKYTNDAGNGPNYAYCADTSYFNNGENYIPIPLSSSKSSIIMGTTCAYRTSVELRMKIQSACNSPVKIAIYITRKANNDPSITNPGALYQVLPKEIDGDCRTTAGVFTYPLVTIYGQQYLGIEGRLHPNRTYQIMHRNDGNDGGVNAEGEWGCNEFTQWSVPDVPQRNQLDGSLDFSEYLGLKVLNGNYGIVYHLGGNDINSVTIDPLDQLLYGDSFGDWKLATSEVTLSGAVAQDFYLVLPGGAYARTENGLSNIRITTY